MLYLLNARQGYRANAPDEITAGALSLSMGSDGLRDGGDRVIGRSAGGKHDLTTIVFERSRLRKNTSFGANTLESGPSDGGDEAEGNEIIVGNSQEYLSKDATQTLTSLSRAPRREDEIAERNRGEMAVDPLDGVHGRFPVRSLSQDGVRPLESNI